MAAQESLEEHIKRLGLTGEERAVSQARYYPSDMDEEDMWKKG